MTSACDTRIQRHWTRWRDCVDSLRPYDAHAQIVSPFHSRSSKHTEVCSRNSGLGDHGFVGLYDFINSHSCNGICIALDLDPLNDLEAEVRSLQDKHALDEEDLGSGRGADGPDGPDGSGGLEPVGQRSDSDDIEARGL